VLEEDLRNAGPRQRVKEAEEHETEQGEYN
jgi:hypothetical protein